MTDIFCKECQKWHPQEEHVLKNNNKKDKGGFSMQIEWDDIKTGLMYLGGIIVVACMILNTFGIPNFNNKATTDSSASIGDITIMRAQPHYAPPVDGSGATISSEAEISTDDLAKDVKEVKKHLQSMEDALHNKNQKEYSDNLNSVKNEIQEVKKQTDDLKKQNEELKKQNDSIHKQLNPNNSGDDATDKLAKDFAEQTGCTLEEAYKAIAKQRTGDANKNS